MYLTYLIKNANDKKRNSIWWVESYNVIRTEGTTSQQIPQPPRRVQAIRSKKTSQLIPQPPRRTEAIPSKTNKTVFDLVKFSAFI